MKHKYSSALRGATAKLIALCGAAALVGLLVAVPAGAAGGGTTVTVRVEGLRQELLAPKAVKTHGGWITKGGTPTGKCSARTAAGALDVATHHRWSATYSASLGVEVTSILGETHPFTSHYYWSIWVDNRFAPAGVCGLTLRKGEQLLFAAVHYPGNPFPLALNAPAHATSGKPFKVTVVWFPAKGKAKPLAGARVDGALTNSHGIAKITPHKAGTLVLRATKAGYIRAAPVRVTVS